jgi:hypothetical protein
MLHLTATFIPGVESNRSRRHFTEAEAEAEAEVTSVDAMGGR